MDTKDLLIEELQQFTEGYKDIDVLSVIADDIIDYTSEKYFRNIYMMYYNKKFVLYEFSFFRDKMLVDFIYEVNQTDDKKVFKKKYGELYEFLIVSECRMSLYGSKSTYYEPQLNRITINTAVKPFANVLTDRYDIFNKEYTQDEYKQILKHALDVGLKQAMIHELQHAYDYYRTRGKTIINKKTAKHYKNIQQLKNPKDFFNDEVLYKQYLNLPNELWARFSDTLYKMPEQKYEEFDDWLWDFKTEFKGYDILSPTNKKRLYNALYKYYDLKQKKSDNLHSKISDKGNVNEAQEKTDFFDLHDDIFERIKTRRYSDEDNRKHIKMFKAKDGKEFIVKKSINNDAFYIFNPEDILNKKSYAPIAKAHFDVKQDYFTGYKHADSIFVEPKYRRLGFASALTDFAENFYNKTYQPTDLLSPEMQSFVKNRNDINEIINEELQQLTEGLSNIIYHFTYAQHLISILTKNQFATSANIGSIADRNRDKGYSFFFSTQRTKGMSGYGSKQGTVAIVLDGQKLNQNYKGFPIDYWNWSTKRADYDSESDYKQALLSKELEDRIVTDKPYIADAKKYILEIHVLFLNQYDELIIQPNMYAQIMKNADGIPVYFYHEDSEFKLMNKNKALTNEEINEYFKHLSKEPDPEFGYMDEPEYKAQERLIRARNHFVEMAPILIYRDPDLEYAVEDLIYKYMQELKGADFDAYLYGLRKYHPDYTKSDILKDITSEKFFDGFKKRIQSFSYYPDDIYNSLSAHIHNNRGNPDKYLRELLSFLVKDMKKKGAKTLKDYVKSKIESAYWR